MVGFCADPQLHFARQVPEVLRPSRRDDEQEQKGLADLAVELNFHGYFPVAFTVPSAPTLKQPTSSRTDWLRPDEKRRASMAVTNGIHRLPVAATVAPYDGRRAPQSMRPAVQQIKHLARKTPEFLGNPVTVAATGLRRAKVVAHAI